MASKIPLQQLGAKRKRLKIGKRKEKEIRGRKRPEKNSKKGRKRVAANSVALFLLLAHTFRPTHLFPPTLSFTINSPFLLLLLLYHDPSSPLPGRMDS